MATEKNTRTVRQRIEDFQSERTKRLSLIYSDPMFRDYRLTFQNGGIL